MQAAANRDESSADDDENDDDDYDGDDDDVFNQSHVHGACKPLTTEATGGLFRSSRGGSVGMVNFT